MTHTISYAISAILISTIVPITLHFITIKAMLAETQQNIFKYTKFPAIIGGGGMIMFTTLYALSLIFEGTENLAAFIFVTCTYPIFMVAGGWLFLRSVNHCLILNEDVMIYRNIWGMVRRFDYKDIKEVRSCYNRFKHVEIYRIYVKGLRLWISIDYLETNFNEFPGIMRKRLKKANNRIEFTKVPPKKK